MHGALSTIAEPFVARLTVVCVDRPNVFQLTGNSSNCPLLWDDVDPRLLHVHGSSLAPKSVPQLAFRSVHLYLHG